MLKQVDKKCCFKKLLLWAILFFQDISYQNDDNKANQEENQHQGVDDGQPVDLKQTSQPYHVSFW